ncbi:hypothetical protein LQV05_000699 [Cryptococcus neoformans]|nr:hypothetical protein LQV05_000699 [Cryptococcus neoformans]
MDGIPSILLKDNLPPPFASGRDNDRTKKVSMEQFYDFGFFECPGSFNAALHCGPLFQELVVDAWAQVEPGRLRFHESNQDNYLREVWQGVTDSAEQGLDTYGIGTRIILPPSFINGPRSFYALYQDAMAIIKLCGKPDIFLTFTCNGYWDEIVAELKEGQKAADLSLFPFQDGQ